jgi:tRNA A-37 threonylcarbamoyl transferase component Bud32
VTRTNPDDGPIPSAEEARLLALADSIDEGDDVDWDAAEREAVSENERAAIRELRIVDQVARVCRNPDAPIAAARAARPAPEPLGAWGRFELIEPMGQGACARVYRAYDPALHRDVALKIFAVDRQSDEAERVRREGRLLARIDHRHVVRVREIVEWNGGVGLAMDLVDGFTLEEELHARGVLGESEAIANGRELCQALAAVHAAGLLHRDIKAQNVMRDSSGRIVLMDLGAGLDAAHATASRGAMAGTPLYLAPELFSGAAPTPASDVYSVGVLLFHLVTGAWPIEAATLDEVTAAHAAGTRRRLRDERPDLSPAFVDVIERAIDPDPSRRFQTAGALEMALAAAWPTPAAPQRPDPQHPARSFRFWRWAAASTGVLALALFASWIGLPDLWLQSRQPPVQAGVDAGTRLAAAPAAAADNRYTVETAFYRLGAGGDTPLPTGSTVRLGDHLGLRLRASRDVFVYVVNEDESGEANLLFPLPGHAVTNPLPAGREHRLPGIVDGEEVAWTVTSSAGAEHFLLFVSPTQLDEVERGLLADLPPAARDRRLTSARLSESSIGRLRGVGGLARVSQPAGALRGRLSQIAEHLSSASEQASGVWVRQVTFENPAER